MIKDSSISFSRVIIIQYFKTALFKDVRGWQFLTIEAAETLCMVCVPPEEHIFGKKYLGNRPFKKSDFISV